MSTLSSNTNYFTGTTNSNLQSIPTEHTAKGENISAVTKNRSVIFVDRTTIVERTIVIKEDVSGKRM